MESPYPRMMYRSGTQERVWGLHDVDLRIVHDEEDELDAMAEGWCLRPDEIGESLTAEVMSHEEKPRRGRPPKARTE